MKTKLEIDDKGRITGLDPVVGKSRLYMPEEDVLQFLMSALVDSVRHSQERAPSTTEEVEMADTMVAMPTGLYAGLIDAIDRIEEAMLNTSDVSCSDCDFHDANLPTYRRCPGVLKKGDLLQNIVGAALRVGMSVLLREAVKVFPEPANMLKLWIMPGNS